MKKIVHSLLIISSLGIIQPLISFAEVADTGAFIEDQSQNEQVSQTPELEEKDALADETHPTDILLKNTEELMSVADETAQFIPEAGQNIINDNKDTEITPFSIGGVTGRALSGGTSYSSLVYRGGDYDFTLKKDDNDSFVFSKTIYQNSGTSYDFYQTIIYSPTIELQTLPEVIVEGTNQYTIVYSTDGVIFDTAPPAEARQIRAIRVTLDKMVSNQKVEIKTTAKAIWENVDALGKNKVAEFYEDSWIRARNTLYFDSYRMVNVKYENEQGETLVEPDTLYGYLNNPYASTERMIPDYQLKQIKGNPTGTFKDGVQEVTYIYERIAAQPVTVNYVDELGNILADSEIMEDGKMGLPYETEPKEISGWTIKEIPANASGLFTGEAQEVNYVYERAVAQPVIVTYMDGNGQKLADPDTLNGKIGENYETAAKDIKGWHVNVVPENATGFFMEEVQEVVYAYERINAQPVRVKFVDEEGKELSDSIMLQGKVGLPYTTEAKVIDSWQLKEIPANATGSYTEEAQDVVYVYTKEKVSTLITDKTSNTKESTKATGVNPTIRTNNKKQENLPKTGEDNVLTQIMINMGLLFLVSTGYLFFKQNKVK